MSDKAAGLRHGQQRGIDEQITIISVVSSGDKAAITGSYHGAPGSALNLGFFTFPNGSSSEGETYLGSLSNVNLGAAGNATFTAGHSP